MAFAIGPITSAVVGLATFPLLTWLYSADDVGRIAMIQVACSFFVLIFGLGLDQSYVRHYHEVDDRANLLKNCMLPGSVVVLFTIIVVMGIDGSLLSQMLFGVKSLGFSLLALLCLLSAFYSRFLSLVLRMEERGIAFSLSQALPKLIFLLLVAVGIFYELEDFDFLLIAHTLSLTAVVLILVWNVRSDLFSITLGVVDAAQARSLIKYGAPLILGGAAFWGLTALDRLFLRNFSTFDELGLYSVASNFAAAAIVFQSIFSTVWVPTVYKWVAEDSSGDSAQEKIAKATGHVTAAVYFIFVGAGLFSWVLRYILPPEYSSVQYVVISCLAYPLFYTLSETTVVGINVTKKSIYSLLSALLALLISAIGNWLLVPSLGAKGAAVATATAFWFFLILRTEFAILLWHPIARVKLYLSTLTCLLLGVLSTLYGQHEHVIMISSWLCLAVGGVFVFRADLAFLLKYISRLRSSTGRPNKIQ